MLWQLDLCGNNEKLRRAFSVKKKPEPFQDLSKKCSSQTFVDAVLKVRKIRT